MRTRGGPGGAATGDAAPPRVRTGFLVGAKAVARSGGTGVVRVHVANDAPEAVTAPVRRLAAAWNVPVADAESSAALGDRCGLGRPVAAIGELTSPPGPAVARGLKSRPGPADS